MTPLVAALRASAALRAVDDPSGLAADRIWIFHGAKDDKVGAAVSDSLLRFYKAFVPLEQVRYETQVPAAHGFPTLRTAAPAPSMDRRGSSPAATTRPAKC